MLCGPSTIWPEPTLKSMIGTSASSFRLNDVQYKVQTPFRHVENLMESAFSIFLTEIKHIQHSASGKTEEKSKTSTTKMSRDSTVEQHTEATNHRRNLTSVNIYVNVIKTSDVHLTLATDECYNITMSCKREMMMILKVNCAMI
jgi:hypothetical protein